jgi:hypothetical protein
MQALVPESLPAPVPWAQFFQAESFEHPVHLSTAAARAASNAKIYSSNYAMLGTACVFVTSLSSPVAALATWAGVGFAAAHAKDYRGLGRIDARAVYAGLSVLALSVIVFTNALAVLCFGALLGASACGAHAVLHEPPASFEGI